MNNNNIDLYISTIVFSTVENTAKYCNQNKLGIEISRYLRTDVIDNLTNDELQNDINALTQNNISKISYHGACFDLNPVSLDSKIAAITKDRLTKSLEIARKFKAQTIIFHSGYNAMVRYESYKTAFIDHQIQFWCDFINDNKVNDIVIALENTYEENPYILKHIYEGVNSEYFKTCIDTGHVNVYSNYDLIYWVKSLEKYLHHFHIHNNFGDKDEHISILKGTIKFDPLFEDIINLDKSLSLTLEIFYEEDIKESLNYIKDKYKF